MKVCVEEKNPKNLNTNDVAVSCSNTHLKTNPFLIYLSNKNSSVLLLSGLDYVSLGYVCVVCGYLSRDLETLTSPL